MPRCEGRPDGPCPAARLDATVRRTKGDLMLCSDCDDFRFGKSYVHKTKSTKQTVTQRQQQVKQADPSVSETALSSNPITGSESGAAADTRSHVAKVDTVVNELLAYITYYRSSATQTALLRVCSTFYSASEVTAAKKFILSQLTSTTRSAHDAELED